MTETAPWSAMGESGTKWGTLYLDQGHRLAPLLPRSNRPYGESVPDPLTGWHVRFIDDATDMDEFSRLHPGCTWAVYCQGVQVDADSKCAISWAELRSATEVANCWVIRTRRGVRFLFASPSECPPSVIDREHQRPDLLAPGRLAVVPPSVHPNGKVYEWLPGHSPHDIPSSELDPPPVSVMDAWSNLRIPTVSPFPAKSAYSAPPWLGLIFDRITAHLMAKGHRLHHLASGGVSITCPFHDDHKPSLSIHPSRGWICFAGCGGGRLTLLAARLNVRLTGPGGVNRG